MGLCVSGCQDGSQPGSGNDEAVVQMVASRDGLGLEQAAAHVEDVRRLADAARAEQDALVDPPPLVSEARAHFLRRGALARVWMHEVFEPTHGVDDIADDDPILQKALASPLHVRPELYRLCQIVAVPSGAEDREALLERAEDPTWRAAAKPRIDAAAARMRRYVRPDDPGACSLMAKLMRFEDKDDGTVELRIESKAFDLDACVREAEDGSCAEGKWVPEWVEKVRPHDEPGFVPTFESRFGYHAVFILEVLSPAPADDPKTVEATKAAILEPWRAAQWERTLDALRKKRAVAVVTGAGGPP